MKARLTFARDNPSEDCNFWEYSSFDRGRERTREEDMSGINTAFQEQKLMPTVKHRGGIRKVFSPNSRKTLLL